MKFLTWAKKLQHDHHVQFGEHTRQTHRLSQSDHPKQTDHDLCAILFIYIYIFSTDFVEHYCHVLSVSIIVFPALLYSCFTFIPRDLSPSVCHTVVLVS